MNDFTKQALAYLHENWHIGITGTGDAADFLGINPNTLKTRLARGQALVLRDKGGRQRAVLTFTGYHLVYNQLFDRLLRFGFADDGGPGSASEFASTYSEWVYREVLSGSQDIKAVAVFRNPNGNSPVGWVESYDQNLEITDATLVVPIGRMALEIAALLYMRSMAA